MFAHHVSRLSMLCLGLLVIAQAKVHGYNSWSMHVPQEDPASPPPVVDGQVGAAEYANAWRFSHIFYRPALDRGPATIRTLINGNTLYMIIDGLLANQTGAPSSLNVTFDIGGNGGGARDGDH